MKRSSQISFALLSLRQAPDNNIKYIWYLPFAHGRIFPLKKKKSYNKEIKYTRRKNKHITYEYLGLSSHWSIRIYLSFLWCFKFFHFFEAPLLKDSELEFCSQTTWVLISHLPLVICVPLGKLVNFSVS